MLIGVFDSGVGGEAVATRLRQLLPAAHIVTVNDHAHVPYGSKSPDEVIRLTKLAIQPLFDMSCDAIVIACNTATTVAIAHLRQSYPEMHFIGIEPMVKPASLLTKTRTIAVCATPQTLASDRYEQLKRRCTGSITVIEPDCATWATQIEHGDKGEINVEATVAHLLSQQVDVIVLGCTHYHYIKDRFVHASKGRAIVLEPTDAIAERIKYLLKSPAF